MAPRHDPTGRSGAAGFQGMVSVQGPSFDMVKTVSIRFAAGFSRPQTSGTGLSSSHLFLVFFEKINRTERLLPSFF
ncbi:MAG TPA: hypothetical protein VNQ90_09680 [Chthoniobacteraceae bacterium]|nr:hypothetical protein [Chthoniobacteraceae bacterium]